MESEEKKMKWCKGHKQEEPIENFGINRISKDGLEYSCKLFQIEKSKLYRETNRLKEKPIITEKLCTKCNEIHEINLFNKNSTSKDGYDNFCKNAKEQIRKNRIEFIKNNKKYVTEKKCIICKKIKSTEYYGIQSDNIDGFNKRCKICVNENSHKTYRENKENVLKRQKEYADLNKDIISEKQKKYYINNKETLINYHKEYYQNNKEKIKEKEKIYSSLEEVKNKKKITRKKYYQNNKEIILKKQKIYIENNKDNIREKRRTRERNKIKNDINYFLRKLVSRTISNSLKKRNYSKNGKSCLKYLSYTIQELKNHLEKHFEPWMNWDNYGFYNIKTWNDDDINSYTWTLDHILCQSDLPYTSMEDENFKKCWALENLRPYSAKQNLLDGATRVRHIKKDK